MIPQSRLVDVIRNFGYTFKTETRSRMVYKERGGTNRVMIPKTKTVTETYVASVLIQIGMSLVEARAFVASCRQEES